MQIANSGSYCYTYYEKLSKRSVAPVKIKWLQFEHMKVSQKMAMLYICFAGIFLALLFGALQISINIFSGQLYEKSVQELAYFSENVNDGLEDIEAQSYTLALDQTIQELLMDMDGKYPSWEYTQGINEMRSILLNAWDISSPVRSIGYIDPQGSELEVGSRVWDIPEEARATFLELAKEARGGFVTYGPTEDCPYLIAGRSIHNRLNMSLKYMGTLVMICEIGDIIEENKTSLEAENAHIFLYSEDTPIYQDETAAFYPDLDKYRSGSGYEIAKRDGEQYFLCWLRSPETDWIYINLFLYSDIYGQVQQVRTGLILCFLCVFPMLFFFMNKLARAITDPLEELIDSMRIVETGDFTAAMKSLRRTDRTDEIGILSNEFYVMLDTVDHLIRENYEKQILLKDTQYKMLRAQINPHFLYNTLNVLNWMVKAGRDKEACKMIVELGALLHYAFTETPYATAQEAVNMVNSYVAIQSVRYSDRIHFQVHTEGDLTGYMIPRMVLQPLVENAILHGADPVQHCEITVTVNAGEQGLYLEVSDTGVGMTEEELEKVRAMSIKPKRHGIGLKNIFERLNEDYGPDCYRIESTSGVGTTITICIPRKGGNTNV